VSAKAHGAWLGHAMGQPRCRPSPSKREMNRGRYADTFRERHYRHSARWAGPLGFSFLCCRGALARAKSRCDGNPQRVVARYIRVGVAVLVHAWHRFTEPPGFLYSKTDVTDPMSILRATTAVATDACPLHKGAQFGMRLIWRVPKDSGEYRNLLPANFKAQTQWTECKADAFHVVI